MKTERLNYDATMDRLANPLRAERARIEAVARDNYGEYQNGCREVGLKAMTLREYVAAEVARAESRRTS